MTIPTLEDYNTTLDVVQAEIPCKDHSCYHCQVMENFKKSELAEVLINNLLTDLIQQLNESEDRIKITGDMLLIAISHGIVTGLRIAEVKELEEKLG